MNYAFYNLIPCYINSYINFLSCVCEEVDFHGTY
jgi:hypothetical protein